VFVVGCLGDWRSAAKVLFESESLQRDITPSREKRKETTSFTTSSFGNYSEGVGTIRANGGDIGGGSETLYIPDVANCLQTTCNDYSRADGFNMITESVGAIDLKPISKTLTASYGTGGADLDIKPLVLEPKAYAIAENIIGRQAHNGGNGNGYAENTMYTLNATGIHGVAFQQNTRNEVRYINGDGQIAGALMAQPGMKQQNYIQQTMRVRRLTPMECERLQGFPDSYTNTPTSSDTTRYKALGNSMAVPVMKWIGQRINELS
jgi:DNA (cytosine-5)-methyltransferase 1